MHVQDGAGSLGSADQPTRSFEHLKNVVSLDGIERVFAGWFWGFQFTYPFSLRCPAMFFDRLKIRAELEDGAF